VTDLDRLRAGLVDAVARGDANVCRALEDQLRGYVRQLLHSDPGAARELAVLVQDEQTGADENAPASGGVTFSNNTINGPVLGSGTQHNTM
jgi:hypothetical protein